MSLPDPPEKSERAATSPLVVGSGGTIPTCPICTRPLSGRQTSACSDKCRAALSRRRKVEALGALHHEVRELLLKALRVLEEEEQR